MDSVYSGDHPRQPIDLGRSPRAAGLQGRATGADSLAGFDVGGIGQKQLTAPVGARGVGESRRVFDDLAEKLPNVCVRFGSDSCRQRALPWLMIPGPQIDCARLPPLGVGSAPTLQAPDTPPSLCIGREVEWSVSRVEWSVLECLECSFAANRGSRDASRCQCWSVSRVLAGSFVRGSSCRWTCRRPFQVACCLLPTLQSAP
jgi:hypothetical protein